MAKKKGKSKGKSKSSPSPQPEQLQLNISTQQQQQQPLDLNINPTLVEGFNIILPSMEKEEKKKNVNKKNLSNVMPQQGNNNGKVKKESIWNEANLFEREKIREFWLMLSEQERRSLVKLEKEAILKKMKEQQKYSCSCSMCGRRKMVIEEELEILYNAYVQELERFSINSPNLPQKILKISGQNIKAQEILNSNKDILRPFPKEQTIEKISSKVNIQIEGGLKTIADDLLTNDGKNFLEIMEKFADKQLSPDDEAIDDELEEDDDDDSLDEICDEKKMEESRQMFHVFAAKMFEQRILTAYREKIALEKQNLLIQEEEKKEKRQKEKKEKIQQKRDQERVKKQEKMRQEQEKARLKKLEEIEKKKSSYGSRKKIEEKESVFVNETENENTFQSDIESDFEIDKFNNVEDELKYYDNSTKVEYQLKSQQKSKNEVKSQSKESSQNNKPSTSPIIHSHHSQKTPKAQSSQTVHSQTKPKLQTQPQPQHQSTHKPKNMNQHPNNNFSPSSSQSNQNSTQMQKTTQPVKNPSYTPPDNSMPRQSRLPFFSNSNLSFSKEQSLQLNQNSRSFSQNPRPSYHFPLSSLYSSSSSSSQPQHLGIYHQTQTQIQIQTPFQNVTSNSEQFSSSYFHNFQDKNELDLQNNSPIHPPKHEPRSNIQQDPWNPQNSYSLFSNSFNPSSNQSNLWGNPAMSTSPIPFAYQPFSKT